EDIEILYTDTSLDTFSQWANSDDEKCAEIALVYGLSIVSKGDHFFSQKQSIYERLKEVRLARENLRLIVIFPSQVQAETDFVSSIAQLAIYDMHFTDDFYTDDIIEWIKNPKGYKHVDSILKGYQ